MDSYTVILFGRKPVKNGRMPVSATEFGRISSNLAEIRPMLGKIRANFGVKLRWQTLNCEHSTVLNDFRPK
jgi:hypothetical protein